MGKIKLAVKKPNKVPSAAKKQKELIDLTVKALTTDSTIHGIWLVRQGLRQRTEQYVAIASNKKDAIFFCRHLLTPKFCSENLKQSLIYTGGKETLSVNYDKDHLYIKGEDFTRQEEGRINQSPLYYWNIAPLRMVRSQIAKVNDDKASKTTN